MKRIKLFFLITAIFLFGCGSTKDSPSDITDTASPTVFLPLAPENTTPEPQATAEYQDENTWEYIIANYPYVTYDEIKTGSYSKQYVILSTTIDSPEFNSITNWVSCDAWFEHDQSYITDNITFYCDELPDYTPQDLSSGDNIDICFYINSDNSFGNKIKGFSENNSTFTLDAIYESFKNNCSDLNYNEILRNPDEFRGKTFTISGSAFQIIKQEDSQIEFLLYTGADDEYIHINYSYKDADVHILENDELIIYGTYYKMYDYVSLLGSNHSIPHIYAEFIDNATADN